MKTKEAIEIIGEKKRNINFDIVPKFENADKIIDLLERGEKYEEMWKEFKDNNNDIPVEIQGTEPNEYGYISLGENMEKLEQKYFPKEKGK